jgi:methyltransferase (TIGR00027 family)
VTPGEASTTALYVAMGRAVADAEKRVHGFSDPITRELLPPDARRLVDLLVSGEAPSRLRDRARLFFVRRVLRMVSLRTVVIDAAVRAAAPVRQLVILGAGLDARAWRMPELADAAVFEVDHPATQRVKRERTASLPQLAREVRFVPVDFQRDALDEALARAGHDRSVPSVFLLEGVVRYLTPDAIDGTLDAVASRAAPGSRFVANYTEGGGRRKRWLSNLGLRWIGEPIRSRHTAAGFAARLAARGFRVVEDIDGVAWAERGGVALQPGERRRWGESRRIVVAARA